VHSPGDRKADVAFADGSDVKLRIGSRRTGIGCVGVAAAVVLRDDAAALDDVDGAGGTAVQPVDPLGVFEQGIKGGSRFTGQHVTLLRIDGNERANVCTFFFRGKTGKFLPEKTDE